MGIKTGQEYRWERLMIILTHALFEIEKHIERD